MHNCQSLIFDYPLPYMMRLDSKSPRKNIAAFGAECSKIQNAFAKKICNIAQMTPVKVMLGDSSVTEQNTFDPANVIQYFSGITRHLSEWDVQDTTTSHNDDLRRIFTKFSVRHGNYIMSGHLSVQYHVLLYYKLDHRVVECQKELSDVIEKTKKDKQEMADVGEQIIMSKIKELGYDDADNLHLFEMLYNDDEARSEIYDAAQHDIKGNFDKLEKKKLSLFQELDSYLLETYQTSHVLIDDTRLVAGEEGYLCSFDLEYARGSVREGLFDDRRIPRHVVDAIFRRLRQVHSAVSGL